MNKDKDSRPSQPTFLEDSRLVEQWLHALFGNNSVEAVQSLLRGCEPNFRVVISQVSEGQEFLVSACEERRGQWYAQSYYAGNPPILVESKSERRPSNPGNSSGSGYSIEARIKLQAPSVLYLYSEMRQYEPSDQAFYVCATNEQIQRAHEFMADRAASQAALKAHMDRLRRNDIQRRDFARWQMVEMVHSGRATVQTAGRLLKTAGPVLCFPVLNWVAPLRRTVKETMQAVLDRSQPMVPWLADPSSMIGELLVSSQVKALLLGAQHLNLEHGSRLFSFWGIEVPPEVTSDDMFRKFIAGVHELTFGR